MTYDLTNSSTIGTFALCNISDLHTSVHINVSSTHLWADAVHNGLRFYVNEHSYFQNTIFKHQCTALYWNKQTLIVVFHEQKTFCIYFAYSFFIAFVMNWGK